MPGNPTLTAFAASPPPWSLASLDTNFTNVATLLKSANNYSLYLVDTGAANAYAVAFAAGVTWTLQAGAEVMVLPANTNTAASTLAVAAGLAKNLFMNGAALVGGEIKANVPFTAVYDGTQYNIVAAARGMTMQVLNSGTAATYTTPTGCKAILVEAIAGGGGGAGTGAGTGSGGTGGTTTFNAITAIGGGGGRNVYGIGGIGGTGGAGTATVRFAGAPGGGMVTRISGAGSCSLQGGNGGGEGGGSFAASALDGAAGVAGVANSGGGGTGAGVASAIFATNTDVGAGGGAQGERFLLLIRGPAATYTYTVGTAGAAGAGALGGGAGGTGRIVVYEFY